MKSGCRSCRTAGYAIAEFGAALVIIIPIVLALGYVAVEAGIAITIYNALSASAGKAARKLAIAYGQDPSKATSTPQTVFGQVTYLNFVTSATQFSIPEDGWNTNANPPTVTVKCTYVGGEEGRPPFPNPDILNLESQFRIQAQATCRLE
jgi:hypothetical protein